MISVEDSDPFAQLDAVMSTPEDAQFWVDWCQSLRRLLAYSGPAACRVSDYTRATEDPELVEMVDLTAEIVRDLDRRVRALCGLDLWIVRTQLEWGLN